MLNHLPVLGTVFGLCLLAYGLLGKKPYLLKVSLGVFVLVALAAGAAYLTGEQAEEVVEHLAGISEAVIEPHEEAAWIAFLGAGMLGLLALGGLIWFRQREVAKRFSLATLVLALAMSGWMVYTANLGGKIHHPEIRSADAVSAPVYEDADDD
ncbi:MAG TPA: hypothetical protein VKP65_01155 [Rhodothermales bacterium]|nr:hypothetical protein [Rhodothermales bacterium]